MAGLKKARKFQIQEDGNPDYEDLINSPMVEVIKETNFSNFANFFVIVHYLDMGYQEPKRSGKREKGEGDEAEQPADPG